jgi:hypothetical protein
MSMIVATLPARGDKVAILFSHPRTNVGSEKRPVIQRSTICRIAYIGDDGRPEKPFAMATVVCSLKDNFCRATGRVLALTRALSKSFFGRGDRAAIWDAYHFRDVREDFDRAATELREKLLDPPPALEEHHETARMEDEGGPASGPDQRTGEEVI